MPAAKPELERGQVLGCWTVLRLSTPDRHGRRRYMCRSTCCGEQRIVHDYTLRREHPTCVHCKGNGQKVVDGDACVKCGRQLAKHTQAQAATCLRRMRTEVSP